MTTSPVLLFGLQDFLTPPLQSYLFQWGDNELALALGLGSLLNHSFEPNLVCHKRLHKGALEFTALRAIAAGEELVYTYSMCRSVRAGSKLRFLEAPPFRRDLAWINEEVRAWNAKWARFAAWTEKEIELRHSGRQRKRVAARLRRDRIDVRHVPRLARPVQIETRRQLSVTGEGRLEASLSLPDLQIEMELTEGVLDLLGLIDGRRTVGEILETLRQRYNVEDHDQRAIGEMFAKLESIGVLESGAKTRRAVG